MTLPLLMMFALGCDAIRAVVVDNYPQSYTPDLSTASPSPPEQTKRTSWPEGVPRFSEKDQARTSVAIHLESVLTGSSQPTDMVFFPNSNTEGLVLEKSGALKRFDIESNSLTTIVELQVPTESEQGLLGIALHPNFLETGRMFLHTSAKVDGNKTGLVSEWSYLDATATRSHTVLEVTQPYANHNGGTIAFGPDGYLFIGLGDGGWRGDPHNHGQNGATLLGSMLRIDVDAERPYGIPPDNPWTNDPAVADEAWAIGLRNPWKFSFAPDGRLVVADVGQNAWEEVSVVEPKDNLGWKTREARHCFPPDEPCDSDGLIDPIYEYARDEGKSITGGYVATSSNVPQLKGQYVFGDFVSGRLWAIPIPQDRSGPPVQATALGQWPFLPSTFGRSADGTLFVADFGTGTVYRIESK